MAIDTDTGAVEQPADLRSMLADAADKVEATERETPSPATEQAETPKPASSERVRGPDGKFAPKQAQAEANTETVDVEASATPAVETEPSAAPASPATPATEAPAHWSQADKEWLAAFPAEHQTAVLNRFKQMEAGFTPKLQRLAQYEREYQGVPELFVPFAEQMRQANITPAHVINAWYQAEKDLKEGRGPQRVANIIKAYGVDPGEVARLLTDPAPAAPQQHQQVQLPPALQEKLDRLERNDFERTARAQQEGLSRAQQQIDTFANQRDDKGNLAHPFFADIEEDMRALAQVDLAAGRPPDLSNLYDRAVYANPTTRSKLLALQKETEAKQAAAERKAKADAAQRAGKSVTGSPGGGQSQQAKPQGGSLRAQLEAAAAEFDAA